MEEDKLKIHSTETNILIELDNISALLRETMEAIDSIRALTVYLIQEKLYKNIAQ